MKIIIFGCNSLVGSNILEFYKENNDIELVSIGRRDGNNSCAEFKYYSVPDNVDEINYSIDNLLSQLNLDEESVIINTISIGDVDQCELNKVECNLINFIFIRSLYERLKSYSFKRFIHFSSNAVYSGDNALYDEYSECNPINYYGKVKLKADNFLQSKKDKKITIVRPITLYGKVPNNGRQNPVSMIVNRLNKNKVIKLVDDMYVNILFIDDLVSVIDKVIEKNFYGLINVSGDVVYSRYELGIKLAKLMNKNTSLVKSASFKDFNTLAKRPENTSFDNSIMKSLGVFPTSLKESLDLIGVI
jgi:dTDP-4-dehydrorhamnose reductase